MQPFSKREVSITMTGSEWFVLAAWLLRTAHMVKDSQEFSAYGRKVFVSARNKLAAALKQESQ